MGRGSEGPGAREREGEGTRQKERGRLVERERKKEEEGERERGSAIRVSQGISRQPRAVNHQLRARVQNSAWSSRAAAAQVSEDLLQSFLSPSRRSDSAQWAAFLPFPFQCRTGCGALGSALGSVLSRHTRQAWFSPTSLLTSSHLPSQTLHSLPYSLLPVFDYQKLIAFCVAHCLQSLSSHK
jgi:hypothetical protein